MAPQGADLVNINGKTFTRSRALAQGLIDAKGNLTAKADVLFGGNREKTSKPATNRARRAAREVAEPETTEDGKLVARKKIEPAKPRNVTKTGEPVTDEAALAKIAAETKAIEAKAKEEREAAEAGAG